MNPSDIIRRCAHCHREFNAADTEGLSHGICKRHALWVYTDEDVLHVLGKERCAAARLKIENTPDSEFYPDLSQVFDG